MDMWMMQMPRRLREAWEFPKRVDNPSYKRVPGTVPPVHPRALSPSAPPAPSDTSPSPPQSPHPTPFNFGRGCRPRVPRRSPSPPPPASPRPSPPSCNYDYAQRTRKVGRGRAVVQLVTNKVGRFRPVAKLPTGRGRGRGAPLSSPCPSPSRFSSPGRGKQPLSSRFASPPQTRPFTPLASPTRPSSPVPPRSYKREATPGDSPASTRIRGLMDVIVRPPTGCSLTDDPMFQDCEESFPIPRGGVWFKNSSRFPGTLPRPLSPPALSNYPFAPSPHSAPYSIPSPPKARARGSPLRTIANSWDVSPKNADEALVEKLDALIYH